MMLTKNKSEKQSARGPFQTFLYQDVFQTQVIRDSPAQDEAIIAREKTEPTITSEGKFSGIYDLPIVME